jgi:hypothetical protein
MARSITADTPDRYLHHTRGRTLGLLVPQSDLRMVPETGHALPLVVYRACRHIGHMVGPRSGSTISSVT